MGTEKPSTSRIRVVEEAEKAGKVVADQGLVGVEPGDPVTGAVFQRRVAGPGEVVVPVALDHRGPEVPGDGDGVVGRAGVVDHHLVGESLE